MADTYAQECGIETRPKPLRPMVQVGGRGQKTRPPIFWFPSIISESIILRTFEFDMLHPLIVRKNPIDFGACRLKGGVSGGPNPPFRFQSLKGEGLDTDHSYSVY